MDEGWKVTRIESQMTSILEGGIPQGRLVPTGTRVRSGVCLGVRGSSQKDAVEVFRNWGRTSTPNLFNSLTIESPPGIRRTGRYRGWSSFRRPSSTRSRRGGDLSTSTSTTRQEGRAAVPVEEVLSIESLPSGGTVSSDSGPDLKTGSGGTEVLEIDQ